MIATQQWVKIGHRPEVRLRIFCFPHAGAGALAFRTWQSKFPEEIDLCSLQPPGRESRFREAPMTRITTLVDAIAEALIPSLDLPFVFYGHSLGALVAFEVARKLRHWGAPQPVHLLVSGCRAPQLPRSDPLLYRLPDTQFLSEIAHFGGISQEILRDKELIKLILPALRADLTVFDTYTYTAEPALACPISAYGGLQDMRAPQQAIDPWQLQTAAKFTLQMFSGGHFFLQTAQDQFFPTFVQAALAYL